MGFLDALLGRTKPAKPDLERLFGLPGARITLEASEQLQPTGQAGVCFKPVNGPSFADAESELKSLLALDEPGAPDASTTLSSEADEYGYRWVVIRSGDFDDLVGRVHLVNTTLEDHGWGPQLLCSVFGFTPTTGSSGRTAYLVYLYKRGSFYPFVPTEGEHRDNEAELRLKVELGEDLAIEKELDRWFPIWKLPFS